MDALIAVVAFAALTKSHPSIQNKELPAFIVMMAFLFLSALSAAAGAWLCS